MKSLILALSEKKGGGGRWREKCGGGMRPLINFETQSQSYIKFTVQINSLCTVNDIDHIIDSDAALSNIGRQNHLNFNRSKYCI